VGNPDCQGRRDRDVLVEDIFRVVGGFQLAEVGESRAARSVVQSLRSAVGLEAEVQAVEVAVAVRLSSRATGTPGL
jgi:hypothetical protein